MNLTSCPCLLEVIILRAVKQSLSIGYAIEPLVVATVQQAVELIELVLGVGEEMGAFLEALRVGQVRCRLPVGIPQTAKWREQPVSDKGNAACAQATQREREKDKTSINQKL